MRRKVHYVIKPQHLWSSITEMARTQNDELLINLEAGFRYIDNESFANMLSAIISFAELVLRPRLPGDVFSKVRNFLVTYVQLDNNEL